MVVQLYFLHFFALNNLIFFDFVSRCSLTKFLTNSKDVRCVGIFPSSLTGNLRLSMADGITIFDVSILPNSYFFFLIILSNCFLAWPLRDSSSLKCEKTDLKISE